MVGQTSLQTGLPTSLASRLPLIAVIIAPLANTTYVGVMSWDMEDSVL